MLIANGTDAATVAELLGHAQTSTTLDIYAYAFDKNKRIASASLQNELENDTIKRKKNKKTLQVK